MAAAAGGGNGVERAERRPTGEETETLRDAVNASRSGYRAFWSALSRMPALSHWPHWPEPFDPVHSEIYGYLLAECWLLLGLDERCGIEELETGDYRLFQRIFDAARNCGVIRFDLETQLWRGMAPPWRRYRKPSEIAAERERYQREARSRGAWICFCDVCCEWFDDDRAFRDHCTAHRPFHPEFDPNRIPELR